MTSEKKPKWRVLSVPIPRTRDPFVNTPLVPVGEDENGVERFWISTWNANVGCLGVLVNEEGEHRMYRFDERHPGFYSAVQEDEDTLWLCGNLSEVVRFHLGSGEYEAFETGAPGALVFQGMVLDRATRKLFAGAHPCPETAAFSFDTRTLRGVKLYEAPSQDNYMRASFPNGDGTWSILFTIPGMTLLRWDPRSDEIRARRLAEEHDAHATGYAGRVVPDERGRWYFPGLGWYEPGADGFDTSGPKPEKEANWLVREGERILGVAGKGESCDVVEWNLASGSVHDLCRIPDSGTHNVAVSRSGKVISVGRFGVFRRHDARSGALEITRVLPADAVGRVDCLVRLDKRRLLGTPFITQRFWEVDVETGKGYDCGRAAPGGGEILRTWKMGGKVYMAAYTGGQLVEYDPGKHPHFPENPRVVADPPGGMRPVASADDGRNIYYSCGAPYGKLGSTLTRYDTKMGLARYVVNPLPGQQIRSMCYDRASRMLLCGTTFHADCQSAPPEEALCYLARLDAEEMTVEEKAAAPEGVVDAVVAGPIRKNRYLCLFKGGRGDPTLRGEVALSPLRVPAKNETDAVPEGFRDIIYAGRAGRFVLLLGERVELWDMERGKRLEVLAKRRGVYRAFVQDGSVYLATARKVVVLENCLA